MKKIIIILIVCIFSVGIISFFTKPSNGENDFLRLHIRANSNASIDQEVKYQVKAAVVEYLSPKLNNKQTKQQVIDLIKDHLVEIENVADKVLSKNNMNYCCSAQINNEYFPTRTYEDLTLENGYYDALILNLGSGSGDNWWCVVYPPLCFVGATKNDSGNIRYKSIFKQLFDNILQ